MSSNQAPRVGQPQEDGTAGTGTVAETASLARGTRLLESAEGVDLTLIRWSLSLTPVERLGALQSSVRSLLELKRESRRT